uniref:CS domain-containing protein n=1 Tax=Meloidogyne hapla TaxID=6305 RepID=A0A1I8C3A5_MELHA
MDEIFGDIENVLFDELDGKSDTKCNKTYNITKFELNNSTKRVEWQLNSKSEVNIRAKIPEQFDKNISINFLHGAIEWNQNIGHTVFQLNISTDRSCIDSYTKERWINLENNKTKCKNHQKLNEGEEINLIFTFGNFSLSYILETIENIIEDKVSLEIPISLVQYIQNYKITCVNDYLLLWKNLQTTVYAEKIKNKWKVKRGIHKDDMENLKDFDIEKEKMAELMEEKYAKDCFKLNKELVEKYNEKVLNKMKNMILRRGKEVFSFKDFTNKVEKEYFILSEDIQKKLGE